MKSRRKTLSNLPRGIDPTRQRRAEDAQFTDRLLGPGLRRDANGRIVIDQDHIVALVKQLLPEAQEPQDLSLELDEVEDVQLSEVQGDNVLTWDGTARVWTNKMVSGETADHGLLSGLADDDHAQYLRTDGARARTGGQNYGGNAITNVSTVDGRDVSVDGAKLDGIESEATKDQTAGEIKTAYESNADTNAFTDSEKTNLANQSGTNTGDEPDATTTAKGVVELATDGESAAGVVVQGNDARMSDARAPTSHAASHTDGSDDVQDATALQKGLMTAAFASKLDGIEAGATADQTAADIRGLGFFDTSNDGAASGLDSDQLDGQEGAHYLARANHTGTQTLATISDSGALAAKDTAATADIDNEAVTYAKIQNVSGSRLAGRGALAGAGPLQELPGNSALLVTWSQIGAHKMLFTGGTPGLVTELGLSLNSVPHRGGSGSLKTPSMVAGEMLFHDGTQLVVANLKDAILNANVDFAPRLAIAMEEAGNMSTTTSGGFQFSVGNGGNGQNTGVVLDGDYTLVSFTANFGNAGNTSTVAVAKNGTATAAAITGDGIAQNHTSTGLSISFVEGDLVNFQTTATGGTLTGPHVMTAYFERA